MSAAGSPFALGTFRDGAGAPFPGLLSDAGVLDLREHLDASLTTARLLEDWASSLESLRRIADAEHSGRELDELRPLVPVMPPGQLFCAGANYRRHVRQMVVSMGRDAQPDRREAELEAEADSVLRERVASGTPFVFSLAAGALSGANDDVVLWGPGHQHDWELELAVVIGRGGWQIPEADALEHVAGYTIANDISTRDVMNRPNFPMTDFLMTKGRPTFKPVGPYIVPREFVPEYRELRITLSVNGEVMQDEGCDDMIYGVERLISYVSTVTTLRPGDILLTGSPAGNAGHHGGRWLRPGDVIDGTITGLGEHHYRCVAPSTAGADKRTFLEIEGRARR